LVFLTFLLALVLYLLFFSFVVHVFVDVLECLLVVAAFVPRPNFEVVADVPKDLYLGLGSLDFGVEIVLNSLFCYLFVLSKLLLDYPLPVVEDSAHALKHRISVRNIPLIYYLTLCLVEFKGY